MAIGMSLSIRSVEEMKQCLFRILQKTINEINPLYNVLDNLWISVYLKDIKGIINIGCALIF